MLLLLLQKEWHTALTACLCESCQPMPDNVSAFPGVWGTAGSVKVWEVQTNPVFP